MVHACLVLLLVLNAIPGVRVDNRALGLSSSGDYDFPNHDYSYRQLIFKSVSFVSCNQTEVTSSLHSFRSYIGCPPNHVAHSIRDLGLCVPPFHGHPPHFGCGKQPRASACNARIKQHEEVTTPWATNQGWLSMRLSPSLSLSVSQIHNSMRLIFSNNSHPTCRIHLLGEARATGAYAAEVITNRVYTNLTEYRDVNKTIWLSRSHICYKELKLSWGKLYSWCVVDSYRYVSAQGHLWLSVYSKRVVPFKAWDSSCQAVQCGDQACGCLIWSDPLKMLCVSGEVRLCAGMIHRLISPEGWMVGSSCLNCERVLPSMFVD
ncbi:hypothetical protein QKR10_gp4 [Oberland virus]|uniref:Uncharacterized protein n=1 Tax=Oberland virus TaxID=2675849 RepID=A0A974MYB5_9MONO|nr:hypothetical protein QKR10_gp4 [Oberland virus]QOI11496.1 hypothetical protein [Oberland virus]